MAPIHPVDRVCEMIRKTELGILVALAMLPGANAEHDAPAEATPHYRLLQMVELSSLQEKINETAAEGYRLVGAVPNAGGTWAAIMERVDLLLPPCQYVVLARKEGRDFQGQINEAASQGFLLVPRAVAQGRAVPPQFDLAWMEKPSAPSPTAHYLLIGFGVKASGKAALNPKLWAETNPLHYIRPQLNAALTEGYKIERVVPTAVVVMEKAERDANADKSAPAPPGKDPLSRYQTLGDYKADKLDARLKQEAARGFHLIDLAPYAPPMWTGATLEGVEGNIAPARGSRYEYAAFATELTKLEAELNTHAAGEFRLFPQSLLGASWQRERPNDPSAHCRVVMERDVTAASEFQYRVIWSQRLSNKAEDIENAADAGFRALGIASFDSDLVVVMEKPRSEVRK